MIDIRKLKAFETALLKYSNNPVIDEIWNELEPMLINCAKHISDIEEVITEQEYHKTNRTKYNLLKDTFERQLLIDDIGRKLEKWQ